MWYYEEWTILGRWSPRTEPDRPSEVTFSGTKRKIRAVREVPPMMTGYDLNVLEVWSDAIIAKEQADIAAACWPVPDVQTGPVPVPSEACRKCGGIMEAGFATGQTFTAGAPDFPGADHVTMSAGGPGRLVPCWKCTACGWSVTV